LFDGEAFGLQLIDRPGPLIRRKADGEALPFVGTEAAALQIFARVSAAAGAECSGEEFRGSGGDGVEALPLIVLAAIVVIVLRQLDARDLRELLDRFWKAQPLELHRECEDVALFTTAEALEEALIVEDVERGALLLMERTARPKVASRR